MILVDIQILAADRVFDFELDENTSVDVLLEDILSLAVQKEHILFENPKAMYLYGMEQETILKKEESLGQQGVRTGDRLILI
ncbi:MAG: EsaB/YukD family protein [Lachnospiraceae bacterium]|nr:EsaB/YukD family protein [Lachnospiraceae bacterium]